MKKLVFIGNRVHVFSEILKKKSFFQSIDVWVLENSPLHQAIGSSDMKFNLFTDDSDAKEKIIKYLFETEFDLLITNGCPFRLPVGKLDAVTGNRVFINVHPTYLPHLKGKTPLNGVIYLDYDFIGATVHHMTDDVDAGNIIYQEKVSVSADIDLGLIYFMSFSLEGVVFEKAFKLLEDSNFDFAGKKQGGKGSTFNRKAELFVPDFQLDHTDVIVRKVRSVGIPTQGVECLFDGRVYTLYEADEISNSWLQNKFSDASPGTLLMKYSNKILVKTINGIVRFSFLIK